jgi:phospholipid/cholesterol/gamma-HCH transport system substrate-binding protein
MTTPVQINKPRNPPYMSAGVGLIVVLALILAVVYGQFRGAFTKKTTLTMLTSRSGLVMDPGAKVTYNGVAVGRVAAISVVEENHEPAAKFILEVYPKYIKLIPQNVNADIRATTLFGNKYVSLSSPKDPTPQRITQQHVIHVNSVTTEENTLFETVTQLAEKVDPVKVNLTLRATAQALSGLGDKFGQSIVNTNAVLDDVNPQLPQVRHDIAQLANLGEVYANVSPSFFDFLNNAATTARTLTKQQDDLDAALLAAVGFGNSTADVFERGGPYLQRAVADLVPTATLLDTYSPELFCTVRNVADAAPKVYEGLGGNGYSLKVMVEVLGSPNPYAYPDNLPRVNARGGPGGAPGCWQPITHDFWPAPYLVMDAGVSQAPYNHFEIGSPYAIEYVWGRQVGENTINP